MREPVTKYRSTVSEYRKANGRRDSPSGRLQNHCVALLHLRLVVVTQPYAVIQLIGKKYVSADIAVFYSFHMDKSAVRLYWRPVQRNSGRDAVWGIVTHRCYSCI